MSIENGIDQLIDNAVQTRVITEDKNEITVIKISFDYVLNDDGHLFTKVPKSIKKFMATSGGATVIKNVTTYGIGSSNMNVTKYYVLLDMDAIEKTKDLIDFPERIHTFILYHEIGHIVLGHISGEGHDCENDDFEVQADEYAFKKTGVKKSEELVDFLAMFAYSSYRKKKFFGNWTNMYSTMDPDVLLNNIKANIKQRFGM